MDITQATKLIEQVFKKHLKGIATDIEAEESNMQDGSIDCGFYDRKQDKYTELYFVLTPEGRVEAGFSATEGIEQRLKKGWEDLTPSNQLPLAQLVKHMEKQCDLLYKMPSVQDFGFNAYQRFQGVTGALADLNRMISRG